MLHVPFVSTSPLHLRVKRFDVMTVKFLSVSNWRSDMKHTCLWFLVIVSIVAFQMAFGRRHNPGGYRRRKVGLSVRQIYYKDEEPRERRRRFGSLQHGGCRQLPRQRRRKCQRRLRPSRSDYLEAPLSSEVTPSADSLSSTASIEPVTVSTTTSLSTSTASYSWPMRDIGFHFAQMADAFAQSLNYRVQYKEDQSQCPKVASSPVCHEIRRNECWSGDGCKDSGGICCFNGCENVCYNPQQILQPLETVRRERSKSA